jgi:uncharacterized protein YegP (UPF0339 family)
LKNNLLIDPEIYIQGNNYNKGDLKMAVKFELYKDVKSEYRWRLVVSNGQTKATAGEGYKSKESAKAGIESVKKNAPIADTEEKP